MTINLFPLEGRKVGELRIDDERAKWARIQFNGEDVTRGFGDQGADGRRDVVVAANDKEGWIAVLSRRTQVITEWRGEVIITFEPCEEVRGAGRN